MSLLTYLVEDNSLIRENLISMLEDLTEVRVVDHTDTEKLAIDWLSDRHNTCDLAVIDLFLREGTGLGVLSACAEIKPGCALVVLSNYTTPEVRRRAAALGADRVFDKSSELDNFVQYCWELTDGRQSAHQAASPRN